MRGASSKLIRVVTYEDRCDPRFNLAVDEAIFIAHYLEVISGSTLRFWRNINSVVLGYFSRLEEEVNEDYLRVINPIIVRRFTGGGSVYHDLGNLNYTVVTKLPKNSKPLDFIYGYLLKGITHTLNDLGLNTEVVNLSDVLVEGRKVSGNAATFKDGYALLHGTLLITTKPEVISNLFLIPWDKVCKYNIDIRKYLVTNLEKILKNSISEAMVRSLIAKNYSYILKDPRIVYSTLSSEEMELANVLYNVKYSKDSWNLRRSYDRSLLTRLIKVILRK